MSSSIRLRTRDIRLAISCDRVRAEATIAREKIRCLKKLVMELLLELETLNKVPTVKVEQGVDFYIEVRHFEIDIIERALHSTEGHQGRAALLLNLNTTTLCAMIKRYNIHVVPTINPIIPTTSLDLEARSANSA